MYMPQYPTTHPF